ncbi:MAG: hypothetical protein GC190_19555 [Alphaproteobacteria bacterium]|nr:hypothetical protein [Alphaproteobacteria bacterium]
MFILLDLLPLLVIPLVIYNLVIFGPVIGPVADAQAWLAQPMFSVHMFSGDLWHVSAGDAILGTAVFLLFIEIVKSTRTDSVSLINHALGTLLFIVFLFEFLTMRNFSNSVFGLLTALQLVDVVAGYTVTAVAAKRDIGSSGGLLGTH